MNTEQIDFLQATMKAVAPGYLGYRDDQERIHEITSIEFKQVDGKIMDVAYFGNEPGQPVNSIDISKADPDRFCIVSRFRLPRLGHD